MSEKISLDSSESVPNLGQIQAPPAENDTYRFFPVPPHSNGRSARFPLFGRGSERN